MFLNQLACFITTVFQQLKPTPEDSTLPNFYQLVVPSGRAQLNVSAVVPFAAGLAVVLLADLAKKASFFEGREARPARRARRVRVHDLMSVQERFKIAMQGKQVERTSRLFTN
jgi:hypothetical protein